MEIYILEYQKQIKLKILKFYQVITLKIINIIMKKLNLKVEIISLEYINMIHLIL